MLGHEFAHLVGTYLTRVVIAEAVAALRLALTGVLRGAFCTLQSAALDASLVVPISCVRRRPGLDNVITRRATSIILRSQSGRLLVALLVPDSAAAANGSVCLWTLLIPTAAASG
jgi:hypothetical protein